MHDYYNQVAKMSHYCINEMVDELHPKNFFEYYTGNDLYKYAERWYKYNMNNKIDKRKEEIEKDIAMKFLTDLEHRGILKITFGRVKDIDFVFKQTPEDKGFCKPVQIIHIPSKTIMDIKIEEFMIPNQFRKERKWVEFAFTDINGLDIGGKLYAMASVIQKLSEEIA